VSAEVYLEKVKALSTKIESTQQGLDIEPRILEGEDQAGRPFRIFFAFNHTDQPAQPQFGIVVPQGDYTATDIATGQPVPCSHQNGRLVLSKPLEPGEIWVVKIATAVAA
jgi:hypothetical protein